MLDCVFLFLGFRYFSQSELLYICCSVEFISFLCYIRLCFTTCLYYSMRLHQFLSSVMNIRKTVVTNVTVLCVCVGVIIINIRSEVPLVVLSKLKLKL